MVPAIYHASYAAVDPENAEETSVNALSCILNTSLLPAGTIDKVSFLNDFELFAETHVNLKIVSLVSSRPRVSKLEFFVALALVALAQSGKGMTTLVS